MVYDQNEQIIKLHIHKTKGLESVTRDEFNGNIMIMS